MSFKNICGNLARIQRHASFKKVKIVLTNLVSSDAFTIIKLEIEGTKKRMNTGVLPDGIVSGKVKNWILGKAIIHLFD